VQGELRCMRMHVRAWLDKLVAADARLFDTDRSAWRAAYARLGSDVALAMTSYADDRSERGAELEAIYDAKDKAEQAKLAWIEPVPEPEAEPREVACKATPAKRTRKTKRE
jgi:hypothetical protein